MSETFGEIIGSLAFEPVVIPVMPDKLPQLTVTLEQFEPITKIVIKYIEGGYYHPSMLKNFNARSQAILKASGETMFGEDRKAGAELAKYSEWKMLWDLIDKDRAANPYLWKYNYRGGKLEDQLKSLTSRIMYKWFSYLASKYILIGSMDEIANDPRLIMHFSYASWNGEEWFKRYAVTLNAAIAKYPGNKEAIFNEAFKERKFACKYVRIAGKWVKTLIPNKAIRQQAVNMEVLFAKPEFNIIKKAA